MGPKILNVGIFFLFIFLSGFWLNRTGKPYSMPLITVHKLTGLAAGIYLGISLYRQHQAVSLGTVQIAVVVITVLLFTVNVTTGSLLSAARDMPELVAIVNKWVPYLTLASTGVLLYLLA
jgi:hypothetical protein